MQKSLYEILDPFHQEDLNNTIHPSIYVEHENYALLILRFPIKDDEDEIIFLSKGFVLVGETLFLYEREGKTYTPLESGWESLYLMLDELIDDTLELINTLREQIIDMEASLYTKKLDKEFLNNWFKIKKDLIAINRVIVRNINTYEQFYKKNKSNIAPLLNHFHDLLEHLTRSQRYIEHDIEKLNTIYSFYSARSNDKMNYSIYILTILSAIFLPLNLMVGFFGMNTGTLPFTEDGGTINVIILLGVTSLTLLLFLMFKKER